MPQMELLITHSAGLHARPASMFVQEANKYSAEIQVTYAGRTVNAKSILGVLTLGAHRGALIEVCTKGKDAAEALEALKSLVETNFGSDEKL